MKQKPLAAEANRLNPYDAVIHNAGVSLGMERVPGKAGFNAHALDHHQHTRPLPAAMPYGTAKKTRVRLVGHGFGRTAKYEHERRLAS